MKIENMKFYAADELKKAKITYNGDIKYTLNGETIALVKRGDEVLVVGECVGHARKGSINEGEPLPQYLVEVNSTIFQVFKSYIEFLPEEKLELGDYVRVKWTGLGEKVYEVVKDSNKLGYTLERAAERGHFAFFGGTLKELLTNIKEESWSVDSYEIFPKKEYKPAVTLEKR